jgi:hypothetical protein
VHKKRVRTKKICGVAELLGSLDEPELRSTAKRAPARTASRIVFGATLACGFGIDDDDVWIELVDRL